MQYIIWLFEEGDYMSIWDGNPLPTLNAYKLKLKELVKKPKYTSGLLIIKNDEEVVKKVYQYDGKEFIASNKYEL